MLRSSPLALLYHFPHSISSLCHSYSVMQAEIFPVRFNVFFLFCFFLQARLPCLALNPTLFFLCWKIPSYWTQSQFIFISQASVMAPGMSVFVCIVKSKSVCSKLFDHLKIYYSLVSLSCTLWLVLIGKCHHANVLNQSSEHGKHACLTWAC